MVESQQSMSQHKLSADWNPLTITLAISRLATGEEPYAVDR